jgi:hypothetical protein
MSNTIKINALKSKIEKLKKGMSAKAATETAKSKAKILIGKYEKEIESLKVKPKKRGTKSAQTSVAKARLLAAKRRAMQGLSTSKSDIEKDAQRPALPTGKRISKDGNTYYEYRENRIDRRPKKYARLEDGGEMMAKGGVIEEGDMVLVKSEGLEAEVIRVTNDNVVVEFINRRPDGGDKRGNYKLSQLKKMADGGEMSNYFANGGRVTMGDLERMVNEYNKEGRNFELRGVYGNLELWSNGHRLEVGSKKDIKQALIKYRFNEKYAKGGVHKVNKKYEYFAVNKKTNKIIDGWEMMDDGGEMMADGGRITKGSKYLSKFKTTNGENGYDVYEIVDTHYFSNKYGGSPNTIRYKIIESSLPDRVGQFDEYSRNTFKTLMKYNRLEKMKYADGGEMMDDGGEMMAFGGRTKSGLMRDRAYKSQQPYEQAYKRKTNPKNPRYNKYADGGEMHRSEANSYSDGGMLEDMIDSGFTISKMRDYLRQRFPDSFGFYLARPDINMLRYGLLKNEENTPLRGLTDEDINNSKIYFPQYKRDHEINFSIDQGGENTYFHFYLNDDEGTAYIGNFGFKDRGDVSPEYITSFIVFLMECYRLPIKVRHEAYGNGGMA